MPDKTTIIVVDDDIFHLGNIKIELENHANVHGYHPRELDDIEDFEPDNIVQQVEPLRKLVEARQKLSDLRSKMDGNDKLETMLEEIIADSDKQKELSDALGGLEDDGGKEE